jgi:hypothetical protein
MKKNNFPGLRILSIIRKRSQRQVRRTAAEKKASFCVLNCTFAHYSIKAKNRGKQDFDTKEFILTGTPHMGLPCKHMLNLISILADIKDF